MWIEQLGATRAWHRTLDGFFHHERRFRSDAATTSIISSPEALPMNGQTAYLPPIGDTISIAVTIVPIGAHPNPTPEAALLVQVIAYDYEVVPNGSLADVTVKYTNDPRIVAQAREASGSFQSEMDLIPIAVKRAIPGQVGTANNIAYYSEDSMEVPYTIGRRQITVLVRKEEHGLAQEKVADLKGFIHLLPTEYTSNGGVHHERYFAFEGADYNQYSPWFYMYRYSWRYDGGVKNIPFTQAASQQPIEFAVPQQNLVWQGDEWIRPPYFRLKMAPNANYDPTQIPRWYALTTWRDDQLNSWTGLIGLPPVLP